MSEYFHLNYYRPNHWDDSDFVASGKFRSRKKVRLLSLILLFLGGSFVSYLLWSYLLVTYSVGKTSQVVDPSYIVESSNLGASATGQDPRQAYAQAATPSAAPQFNTSFFNLTVPALNLVNALVTTNVTSSKEEIYFPILEKSIAHYQGSALPGERGNVFLYGHSVLPQFFNPNDYTTIFSNLHKMKNGDSVYVKLKDKVVEYQVTGKKIIGPKDIEAANLSGGKNKTLTLMTCYPPGLTTQRLLVFADQVEK